MHFRSAATAGFLALLSLGSSSACPVSRYGGVADLEGAQLKWNSAGLKSYSYRFNSGCGLCPRTPGLQYYLVQVHEDSVTKVHAVVKDSPGWEVTSLRARTITQMFDDIRRLCAKTPQAMKVTATFNEELGYPEATSSRPADPRVADGDGWEEISHVTREAPAAR